eukprot:gene11969-13961_t
MDSLMDHNLATEIELAVDLSCGACVEDIRGVIASKLTATKMVDASVEDQRIVVSGTDLTSDVIDVISATGRSVSIRGFGSGGSAVCSLGTIPNWEKGCGGAGGEGSDGVNGVMRVIETAKDTILFEGRFVGLANGDRHSIAVHQYGDLTKGCDCVGDIYIPPTSSSSYNGILGTSTVKEDGRVQFRELTKQYGDFWDLIGRSIVLHSHNGDGSLNKRVACGVICRAASIGQNPKKICPCDNQPTERLPEAQL